MLSNGRFIANLVLTLLEDHGKMAALEWRYEKTRLLKRAGFVLAACLLLAAACALVQAALFWEGLKFWRSAIGVSLTLAGINFGAALLLLWVSSKRDPRAGRPFQATQEEWDSTRQWIRELFS